MNPTTVNLLALIGRVLLAAIFIWSGIGKIGGFEGTVGYVGSRALPMPQVLAGLATLVELVGGALLVIGWKARWAALALAIFSLLAAMLFHNYWTFPPAQQMSQQISFMKNLSMAGGLLMVVAFGAGRWSIDKR